MEPLFDINAPKKPTNLSVNSDLLKQSRALNINLSATLEQALKTRLGEAKAADWASRNQNAIKSYNEFVEANGCFGEEYRGF